MEMSKSFDSAILRQVYDFRHNPVIQRWPLTALSGENVIKEGQVVKLSDSNTVEAAATGDAAFFGIALENVKAGDEFINVLLHGSLKKNLVLVGEAEATLADIVKLKTAGIYCLD